MAWCQAILLRHDAGFKDFKSGLTEHILEYSLEELMLMLKLRYFGSLIRRIISLEKTLMLGKIEGRRRRG